MRGEEAKRVCPDIHLVQVPVARGKADLNSYRDAGSEVISILATKGRCERASIDEAYIDLTDAAESMLSETPPEMLDSIEKEALKSHILGVVLDGDGREQSVRSWLCRSDADHGDKLLACAAVIVAQLRVEILRQTEFTCSAGIAHNKILAKLASAMHKPSQQTVVPSSAVKDLLASLPIKKMKQLGGKLGTSLQSDLGVSTVGDLLKYSIDKLQELYGTNTGTWLWNIARGLSGDEVEGRLLPKSHGCGKTFPGPRALKSIASVQHWINQLCEELDERLQSDLEQNKRMAYTLTLHARALKANDIESQRKFPSKSCPLRYGAAKIQEDAMKLFNSGLRDYLDSQNNGWRVTSLSVIASKILDAPPGTCSILKFFGKEGLTSSTDSDMLHPASNPPFSPSDGSESIKIDQNEQQARPTSGTISYGSSTTTHGKTAKGISAKKQKEKDSSSILKYFANSVSSFNQACHGNSQPVNAGNSNLNEDDDQGRSIPESSRINCDFPSQGGGIQQTTFTFSVEDIDPSVIDELPWEIQQEVRGWLHLPKRANTNRRGTDIASYFKPAKGDRSDGRRDMQ